MKKVNVGLIGFGVVGSGVIKVLRSRRSFLREKLGLDIVIKKICDKDITSRRPVKVSRSLLTKNANAILNDPEIDIVVELIGGVHPAKEIILKAIQGGKNVVTANKALLADSGLAIFAAAKKAGVQVGFEASVGGSIPVIKALRESYVANRIDEIHAIINGTCNYILTQMSQRGLSFKAALKKAQEQGIAEQNPALDVSGRDSAHKLAIMTFLAAGILPAQDRIFTEGILDIDALDIEYAKELGYAVKLLAIFKRRKGALELRVHPTFISTEHPLAGVRGSYNAIYIKSDLSAESLLYGRGAGMLPTASAVVSDIVDIAKGSGGQPRLKALPLDFKSSAKRIRPIDEVMTRFYVRFLAVDKPGVLAAVSSILAKYKISIASVTQKERRAQAIVPIVMMTHQASERVMRLALKAINRLPTIRKKSIAIRIED